MKRVMRIAILVVIVVMLVGALASCRRGDDVDLVFAWWGGDVRAEQTHQVIEMFLAQTDNVDYIEGIFTGFGDHWTDMSVRAAAGNLPDILQHDVAWILSYVEAGHLVDLTPLINDNRIDLRNVPQAAIDAGRVPGHPGIYAVPTGMNVAAMLYNATLLEELGLYAPRNMTLDQFINLSREIYERSGVRTNWAHNDPFNQMNVHLRAQGASLFTPDGRLGGTVEQYRQFFDVIIQGIEEGWHIRPEHMDGRESGEQNALWYPHGAENANFRTWNSPVWSNMLTGYMHDAPEGMRIGMTTYPSVNPILGNFGRATMFLTITTQSDNIDAAAEFISFYMNSVEAHQVIMGDRGVVVNPVVGAAIAPMLPEAAIKQLEFVEWVNNGNSSPYSPARPAAQGELLARLRLIVEDVTRLNMTAQEAAEEFDAAGRELLN
ncbi:MAG: ABC transporter substrate-binding protein [Firmicutes bacterium]|nr:ABC transporter substrate-binding protein [Bacillota bacterium]